MGLGLYSDAHNRRKDEFEQQRQQMCIANFPSLYLLLIWRVFFFAIIYLLYFFVCYCIIFVLSLFQIAAAYCVCSRAFFLYFVPLR